MVVSYLGFLFVSYTPRIGVEEASNQETLMGREGKPALPNSPAAVSAGAKRGAGLAFPPGCTEKPTSGVSGDPLGGLDFRLI